MSLSPLWRICAAVAAAVVVGVALGAWWVRSETLPGEPVRGATEGRIAEVPTFPEPAAATDSPPTAPAPKLPEVHEIRAACPSLIGELTAECESALERRFVGNWASRPGSFVPGVTYGELFALDGSTYATVRDALLRPECRVPPGRMRADLGESCAADAMARLALLHFVCDVWTVEDPDGTDWLRLESRFENQRWDVEPDNAEWRDQQSYLRGREIKELNAYEGSSPATPPADSRPPVASYDRLEKRPADAYLGNRFLSASGDFDNDGLLDEVFFAKADRMISLVVSFGSETKRDRLIKTLEKSDDIIRRVGVKVAPAGQYTETCAGAGDPCAEGKEESVALPHDGFVFFYYEATARLYYLPEDALDGDFKTLQLAD